MANFDLHYYFDAKKQKSNGNLYNDNGLTPNAFEKVAFEILNFNANNNNGLLTIKLNSEIGKNYSSSDKNVNLIIHAASVKSVSVNGKNTAFKINTNTIESPVSWEKGTAKEIKIQY